MAEIILGIDPGGSGALAIRSIDRPLDFYKLDNTELDINNWLISLPISDIKKAYIENVHSMPKQGVASSFKFGKNFGFLIGLLTANKIPYELVSPQRWQKAMQCQSHGDKNITKAAAQRLFPNIKITHANADAILIAEYGWRIESLRKN